MSRKDGVCSICDLAYDEHVQPFCEVCLRPHEHHTLEQYDEEWEARSRMAYAKVAAGLPLDDTDRKARRRFPDPAGYVSG